MTKVTIATDTVENWQYGGSTCTLRGYASDDFIASDGTIVLGGNPGKDGTFYREIACTIASKVVTIPEITLLDSTEDSDVQTATYLWYWFDADGTNRGLFAEVRVPGAPTPTTWATLIEDSRANRSFLPPHYYSSAEVDSLITGVVAGGMTAAVYDPAGHAAQLVTEVDVQILTNKTLTQPTLVLKQGTAPTPTTEGDIQWDTDNNQLKIGDGVGTKVFSDDSALATAAQGALADSALQNVVEDVTPQLGANLDLNGFVITGLEIGTDIQSHAADLDAIAALLPANDDVIQRKAGVWTNRTPAQLAVDIGAGDAFVANPLSQFAATTSLQLKDTISDETGSGALVFATSPVLVTPNLGTPSALVGTNISGTGASFTAGNVTTNANLTGVVTSVGNATAIANKAIAIAKLADGTDGELITWDASGVITTVAVGTATHVLTSNGPGVAPTFQAAPGGDPTIANEATDTTCFVNFTTAATGTLPLKSNAGLTFNSATAVLTATGFSGPLTGNVTGNADTVTTNANLTGDVTSVGNATTIAAGAVDIAMLSASGTPDGTNFLRGDNTWATPAGSGDVTGDTASVDKEFVRFNGVSGTIIESPNTDLGTTTATLSDNADVTFYDAVNDGNPVFAYGSSAAERLRIVPTYDSGAQTLDYVLFATDVASATADKGLFRFNVDGTNILDIDDGGITLSTGVFTGNLTGNADTVTTNANLTGIVTSTGNATAIANKAIAIAKLADGTDGELITWDASGVITTVAVGTSGHVLTSNGPGAAPTFQAAPGGDPTIANEATDTTCFVNFTTAATGTLPLKSNAGLTFNSATGMLSATGFTGPLTGNADTVTTNANLTGEVTSTGNAAVIDKTAISGKALVTAASGDMLLITDATDTDNLKRVNASDFLAGSGDVTKVGTPVDNQVGVWTGDGTIEGTANLTFAGGTARTSGAASYFTMTSPADTGQTASTEAIGVHFDLSATRQWATGALTTQREIVIESPTYGFVGASTITNAITMDIVGVPVAGTNATFSNHYGIRLTDSSVPAFNIRGISSRVSAGANNAVSYAIEGILDNPHSNGYTNAGVCGQVNAGNASGSAYKVGVLGIGSTNTANTEIGGAYFYSHAQNSSTTPQFGVFASAYRNADSGTYWRVGVGGMARQGTTQGAYGGLFSLQSANPTPAHLNTAIGTMVNQADINLVSVCNSATHIGFEIQAASAQSADLISVSDLAAGDLFKLGPTGAITFADGVTQIFNPDGTNAGLNFGSQAGDPSTPSNGDVWYNSTSNKFRGRENGASVDLVGGAGGGDVTKVGTPVDNQVGVWTGDGTIEGTANFTYGATNQGIFVQAGASTEVPLTVKLASTPSANAIEVNSSGGSGGDLMKVASDGDLTAPRVQLTDTSTYIRQSTGMIIGSGGTDVVRYHPTNKLIKTRSDWMLAWSPTTNVTGTADLGIRRISDGVGAFTVGWNGSTYSNYSGFFGGGAAVASAAALPLPTGRTFHVTGTTGITSITSTNFESGCVITLIFDGVLTVTDGGTLKLNGNYTTAADDTLTLVYDGTNWHEIARSATSGGGGVPTQITVADESADTTCFVMFATDATGDIAPKTGTNLTFNSSSGALTASSFVGPLTGQADTVATIAGLAPNTATTAAAQPNITSLGTLTSLQVDNININGNTISSTAGTDLLITPLAGQQIVLDGTIVVDAGVVTGATSITSDNVIVNTKLSGAGFQQQMSFAVENPTSSEDLPSIFTNRAITITEIRAVLVGSSTPSVTWTVRHGTDRSAAGAEVVTGGTATTSITTGSDVVSFNDATVVADSHIWVETTAQSGTVTSLSITIFYTVD